MTGPIGTSAFDALFWLVVAVHGNFSYRSSMEVV